MQENDFDFSDLDNIDTSDLESLSIDMAEAENLDFDDDFFKGDFEMPELEATRIADMEERIYKRLEEHFEKRFADHVLDDIEKQYQ